MGFNPHIFGERLCKRQVVYLRSDVGVVLVHLVAHDLDVVSGVDGLADEAVELAQPGDLASPLHGVALADVVEEIDEHLVNNGLVQVSNDGV